MRRQKLQELQDAGKNPFVHEKYDVKEYSTDIKDNYSDYEGKEVSVAGRVMRNGDMERLCS